MTLSAYAEVQGRVTRSFRDTWLFDAFWVAFLVGITRINILPDFNTLAWAGADGLAVFAIIRDPEAFLATLNRNKLIVSWPVLSALSYFWSLTPTSSLYHAIQFLMVLFVAFVFFQNLGVLRLVRILFIYNLILQLGSAAMLTGGIPVPGMFTGLFGHKNLLGMFSTLQIMCGGMLFLAGWQRWLCAASMVLALVLLGLSASGTSILLTAVVIPLFFMARIVQRGMHPAFTLAGLAIALVGALGLLMVASGQTDPVESVFQLLGKDDTLTGRSILWEFGMQSIADHPVLGVGFQAYWASPGSSAAYLVFVIDQELEMFHNVYVEVTVALGFVGLALFVSGMAQQIWRSLVYLIRQGTAISCWPFLFMVWIAMLCTTENPIFGNSHLQFIFAMTAAATYACDPRFARITPSGRN